MQKPAALQHFFASSFHEMYNCTKYHTGSAVTRVTKDRAARPHLPSTVENQLGRRRQLLTIAQWNVRTLLDREGADRPEREKRRENDKWPLVMGKDGTGKCNSNGELLLALSSEFELIVMNTMLNYIVMHPRSRHWHVIDFIITMCRDKMDIHSTQAMREANCWTNHQMLRSKVAFRL